MRGAPRAGGERPSASEGVLTVSRLAALVRGALEERLPSSVRVVGEISGARRSTHLYLQLKDAGAVIGAVIFANRLAKVGFEPRDGQEVVATGRVEFYEPQGRVTLVIERLEPVGEGAAELRFRQLCEELRGLGWLAPERKRPLPAFPRRVAVVTSPTGAALQDVLTTMAKRCPAVGVVVVPVRVQGDAAAAEVVRAVDFVSREHQRLGVDAVIVTRGGGSKEDLAAFNEREVARAIVECRVPVVAAIGHETDTTIAELAADERCATPTQAAVRLTPDREALGRQLDALGRRFATDLARTIRFERQRLAGAAKHPVLADPRGATRLAREQLATARDDLEYAAAEAVREAARRLEAANAGVDRMAPGALLRSAREDLRVQHRRLSRAASARLTAAQVLHRSLEGRLDSIGPAAVLRRGYSCTVRPDGGVVRNASEVAPGDRLVTYLAEGSVESDVVGTSPRSLAEARRDDAGRPPVKPRAQPAEPRSKPPAEPKDRSGRTPHRNGPGRDQLDLFGGGE